MAVLPQLRLSLASETTAQKALQFVHGRKHLVRTGEHPAADFSKRELGDHIYRDAFAVRERQLGGSSAALQAGLAPETYDVVRFVLDQVQIELYDFSHDAAESLYIGRLPFTEVRGLFIRQVFLFVLGGVVDPVP